MCVIVSSDSGSISCRASGVANESIGLRSEDHTPRFHVPLTQCIHEDKQVAEADLVTRRCVQLARLNGRLTKFNL